MDGDGMTQEEYVDSLLFFVTPSLVEFTKDWPTSDKMYVFLHDIQLQKMDLIKEMLMAVLRK